MPSPTKNQGNFSVSKNPKKNPMQTKNITRSRVLTDKSGYAAAEFNFPLQHFSPPLIISEPNEDTSSWQ